MNNQWEHCGRGATCDDAAIAALDLSDHGVHTTFVPAQAQRAPRVPVVTGVAPTRGREGELLHIFGSGFNVIDGHFAQDQCADMTGRNRCIPLRGNCVRINGVSAPVEAVTPTMLVVRWPFTCTERVLLGVTIDLGTTGATSVPVAVMHQRTRGDPLTQCRSGCTNEGWINVGADIVWPNPTGSANVCAIDTGVDYTHPDLSYTYSYTYQLKIKRKWKTSVAYATAYRVYSGYDFVNADADAMDDNGHGTHVAGIMVAMQNNAAGISGVSTGNVVTVKALDAQGMGTNFYVAKAIQYCADRTDVRVINLSLGGPAPSAAIHDALLYAPTPTTTLITTGTYTGFYGKGKLVGAAAGNNSSQTPTYPAGYADPVQYPEFPANSILSVVSTGKLSSGSFDYQCKASTSNWGVDWVNVAAPGEMIYSTTPYDKPFYQNYYGAISTRYDYMSGTSMATAFVSASAARRMGYKPLETNSQVGAAVIATGDSLDIITPLCTPGEIPDIKKVNVASLLDRASIRVSVFDAATGAPHGEHQGNMLPILVKVDSLVSSFLSQYKRANGL